MSKTNSQQGHRFSVPARIMFLRAYVELLVSIPDMSQADKKKGKLAEKFQEAYDECHALSEFARELPSCDGKRKLLTALGLASRNFMVFVGDLRLDPTSQEARKYLSRQIVRNELYDAHRMFEEARVILEDEGETKKESETVTIAVACDRYHVSPPTIRRHVANGKLINHRPADAPRNSPILVDEHEVARHWPRKSVIKV